MCKESGHTSSGFCGSSLDVSLYVEIDELSPNCHLFDSFWMNDVLFLAEIKCASELAEERIISKVEIDSRIRTKEAKCNPYLRGNVVSVETSISEEMHQIKKVNVSFNLEHKAWHYGWISHKCSSDTSHVVDVLVLVENDTMVDYFFLAASFHSPEFIIMSTKTGRQKKDQGQIASVDENTVSDIL